MNKKICVVTGATSGLGLEAAKQLAQKSFFVVLGCRNTDKAQKVISEINRLHKKEVSCCIELDLSSFESIEKFAEKFSAKFKRLDLLINNAGTICDRHQKTEQGFAMTMGVNYIGHVYLSELLLPIITKTHKARIINVSSIVGIKSKLGKEILDFQSKALGIKAYTASKLAQILYTLDLAERLKSKNVSVIAMHPGVYGTNIWSGEGLFMRLTKPLMKIVFPSPKSGAKKLVYLATSKKFSGVSGAVFSKTKKVKLKYSCADDSLRKKLMTMTKKAINEVAKCEQSIAI